MKEIIITDEVKEKISPQVQSIIYQMVKRLKIISDFHIFIVDQDNNSLKENCIKITHSIPSLSKEYSILFPIIDNCVKPIELILIANKGTLILLTAKELHNTFYSN
ncbi:MAG: hypothetical protein GX958_07760 [Desulfitobacterium sp.]|nr:hypothetical protein [Desulfitobacterium sp.]